VARRAKYTFTLPNTQLVGYGFVNSKGYLTAQFKHPTKPQYIQASTGIEVPAKWYPGAEVPGEAHTKAAQAVLKAYAPTIPADPRTATWETVMEDLEQHEHLRPRAWEVYTSILNVFRSTIPESKGPNDVDLETARRFRKLYQSTPFTRSPKPNAPTYKRTPKTVENAIRKLSSLWEKMRPEYVKENVWEYIDRPTVPEKLPTVPSEEDVTDFYKWLEQRHPGWQLPKLFVDLKAVTGRRLNDLCHVHSWQLDPILHTVTIQPDQDKTHKQLVFPIPEDLFKQLYEIRGEVYLWERYLPESKVHRPSKITKKREDFTPALMYHAMQGIFREFKEAGGKLTSHGLRKRAITLMTLATQNVDQTAAALGVSAQTARKHYLDAKRAFDGSELLKKMADVLRPKT